MPNLVETIQQIVNNTMNSNSLTNILFGTVTSDKPLKILVEQKFELTEEFLILTKNVKDYSVNITVDWDTENTDLELAHSHNINGSVSVISTAKVTPETEEFNITIDNSVTTNLTTSETKISKQHNHSIAGKKTATIHNALKIGDKVILIQQSGGQKFVVLDKI